MMTLGALGCALVCLVAGLSAPLVARRDGRVLALAAVQLVGGGVLAALIGWLFGLTGTERAALILLGVAPGTGAAASLVGLAGGDVTLALGTASVGGFAGLAATALLASLAPGAGGAPLVWLAVGAALPMWAGLRLRGRVAPQVQRAAAVLAGLALGAMILAGLVFGTAGAALWPLAGAVLMLTAALAVLGHAAGRAVGGGAGAVTGAAALPMRNVAVPLLAGVAAGMPAVPLAAAIMGIVMYLPAIALVFAAARRRR